MKSREKPRPGVIVRFDWFCTLEKLSDQARSLFLMACLCRGRDLTFEPDINVLTDLGDRIRFETLWEQARTVIDEDGRGWADSIIQRKFAGYSSACQRRGEVPMSYEEYRLWYERVEEIAPEAL